MKKACPRTTVGRRFVVALAAALGIVGAAFAVPTAPTLKMTGFFNGKLTFGVKYSPVTDHTLEVQMKDQGAADDDYVTIYTKAVNSLAKFLANKYDAAYFTYATNFAGTATFRMRTTLNGEASDWVAAGDFTAYVNVTGATNSNATTFGNAVDGNMYTNVDEPSNPWVGYDYNAAIRISRIRVISRPDLISRFYGAKVQIASDATFADATTVFTSSSANTTPGVPIEIVFDEPVTAKSVRVLSGTASGCRSSVCEFEVVPADVPFKPVLTVVGYDDVTNFYPVLTWTVPAELHATKATLEYATGSAGPFTALATDVPIAITTFTNTAAKVGVLGYYRVTVDCNHPLFPGQSATSDAVTMGRCRRLDRSWGNETTLLDGVTVMPATNGVYLSDHYPKAFDGNPDTFPDIFSGGTYSRGPVGLDFGEPAWVTSFGYICRNDNWCYVRIKNTALFSADDGDVELTNKVQRSEKVTQASQDKTFYTQMGTSLPDNGARKWFLYAPESGPSEFGGNVAELMFFGWTQSDLVAAGVVTAPTTLGFARSADGLSVDVGWNAGINVVQYRLERRVYGTNVWGTVATVAGTSLACNDNTVSQNIYEYRVVSIGSNAVEAVSEPFTYTYYAPGTGTGLRGAVYAPYVANVAAMCQPEKYYELPTGPVNLSVAKGVEIVAGSSITNNMRLLWRGKLVTPFTGAYTFTLVTTDGGALYIDKKSVANAWTDGPKTTSGMVELTAGEHDIAVDARLQVSPVSCVLKWGGVVPDEVIPATQLIPAAEAATLTVDGWTQRTYNGQQYGNAYVTANNAYMISSSKEAPSDRNKLNATFLAKTARYSFDISARFRAILNGEAGIMARVPNGNFYAVEFKCDGSGFSYYGVRGVTNNSDTINMLLPWKLTDTNDFSNVDYDLRLVYDSAVRTFHAYAKDNNKTEWNLIHTWHNDRQITGDYEYGFVVHGASGNPVSSFTVTPLSIRLHRPGLTVLFK